MAVRAVPPNFEVIEPQMARVLSEKTGAQRLQIVDRLLRAARALIESNVRTRHPDWDDAQVSVAIARRIAGGTH